MVLLDGLLGVVFWGWLICSVIVGVGTMLHLRDGGVKGNPRDDLLWIAAGPLTLLVVIVLVVYMAIEQHRDPDADE